MRVSGSSCFKLKNLASAKTQHYCILYTWLSSSTSFPKNTISHRGFSQKCVFCVLWVVAYSDSLCI